ncbi:hypothetical protein Q8G41_28125, partial [Klebsiella pneumoniae]|uniref:hypothetical protein n=1 Tax=Klebsiella pneumoniae TaxID=573 RepID=UPI0030134204
ATRNKCTPKRSEGNHHRWPKGRESDLLAFFAKHALGGPVSTAPSTAAPSAAPSTGAPSTAPAAEDPEP